MDNGDSSRAPNQQFKATSRACNLVKQIGNKQLLRSRKITLHSWSAMVHTQFIETSAPWTAYEVIIEIFATYFAMLLSVAHSFPIAFVFRLTFSSIFCRSEQTLVNNFSVLDQSTIWFMAFVWIFSIILSSPLHYNVCKPKHTKYSSTTFYSIQCKVHDYYKVTVEFTDL